MPAASTETGKARRLAERGQVNALIELSGLARPSG